MAYAEQAAAQQGDFELRFGHAGEARQAYERGLRLGGPTRPRFLLALAFTERVAGRPEEARRLLAEVLALEPGNAAARKMLDELGARP